MLRRSNGLQTDAQAMSMGIARASAMHERSFSRGPSTGAFGQEQASCHILESRRSPDEAVLSRCCEPIRTAIRETLGVKIWMPVATRRETRTENSSVGTSRCGCGRAHENDCGIRGPVVR